MSDDREGPQPGELIADRYRITAVLGHGGFASTFAAHDLEHNQLVAVKALSLEHIDNWKSVDLFRREANVLRGLDHPQIPRYIDFVDVEADHAGYLVQALAPGTSLSTLLGQGRKFSGAECLDIGRQVLRILDYLGSQHPPVVHRDIKPANLILDESGEVRLVDFGAVRELATHTVSGSTMVGTLGYMAPEQLSGEATRASDIYGLGMTLVHLLTGTSPTSLPKKRLKPDFASAASVDPAFELVLSRMLEAVPEDRIGSAAAALELLGDTSIVAVPHADARDEIDSLVLSRDSARAEEARQRQAAVVARRAAIARRRAEHRAVTELTTTDGNITLSYAPLLRDRLRNGRGLAIVGGFGIGVACVAVIVFGILQGWHVAIIANLAIWLSLFGGTGVWWASFTLFKIRPISITLNPQGNFMVYRREGKALAYGHAGELDLTVCPANPDEEFGSAVVSAGSFNYVAPRLTTRDVATFQQFRELLPS